MLSLKPVRQVGEHQAGKEPVPLVHSGVVATLWGAVRQRHPESSRRVPGGDWAVLCEWGRIGKQGSRGMEQRECTEREEALYLAAEMIALRLRHGYAIK